MAFKNVKKLPDFTGVAADALATADVPEQGEYFSNMLRCLDSSGAEVSVANMKADITNLRGLINGETIIDASAEFLLKLQNYYYAAQSASGDVNAVGQLPLNYARNFYKSSIEGDVFGLGMGDIDSFNLEVNCGAAAATATHISKIENRGERSEMSSGIGQHVRVQKFPQNFGSTGEQEITDLPREPNVGVLAYHISYDDATTDLDEVTLIINSSELIKVTKQDIITLQEKSGRTPQFDAGGNSIFTLDFALSNDLTGYLDMSGVADLRIRTKWSNAAPANYTIYREAVFGLNPNRK